MRRDTFRNLEWLKSQPTVSKGPLGELKYQNPGVRVWLNTKNNDTVTKEFLDEKLKVWTVHETFRAVSKKELLDDVKRHASQPTA